MTTVMSPRNEEIGELIFDRGILVSLFIGRFHGIKKLTASDMLLEEREIDSQAVHLGHKKLLPYRAMQPLVRLESEGRTTFSARSLPFPISGARFVTRSTLPALVARLRDVKDRWDTAVAELIEKYPEYQEEQLRVLDAQARRFADERLKAGADPSAVEEWLAQQRQENLSLYPPASKLYGRFAFNWRLFQITGADAASEILDEREYLEAQANYRRDLQNWVRDAASMMHKALGEAAAQARSMLEKNGKLNPRNLRPLFEAFESFKAVDFTGQSSFQATIDDLRTRYLVRDASGDVDYEATAVAIRGSQTEFDSLLGTMSELALDAVADQAGLNTLSAVTEFKRVIELD